MTPQCLASDTASSGNSFNALDTHVYVGCCQLWTNYMFDLDHLDLCILPNAAVHLQPVIEQVGPGLRKHESLPDLSRQFYAGLWQMQSPGTTPKAIFHSGQKIFFLQCILVCKFSGKCSTVQFPRCYNI